MTRTDSKRPHQEQKLVSRFPFHSSLCRDLFIQEVLNLAEELTDNPYSIIDSLRQKITAITQGQVQFIAKSTRTTQAKKEGEYPVSFNGRYYGDLVYCPPSGDTASNLTNYLPTFSLMCGMISNLYEILALINVLKKNLEEPELIQLTSKQRQVLDYIILGLDDDEICLKMNIQIGTLKKHRQRIYEAMNVHRTHDVVLMAYQSHLLWSLFLRYESRTLESSAISDPQ
jgi:DNA-binding CsgD family transcriptional regulator